MGLFCFGEGNSFTKNKINYFDSSYVVCLSASNLCGESQVCDTVRVDSSGLIAYSFVRNTPEKESQMGVNAIKETGIQLLAYPNPMGNEVNFIYSLEEDFNMGEIVLQNCLAQTVAKRPFNARKGRVSMESPASSGIYFYQVLLDGVVVKTGKLVRE